MTLGELLSELKENILHDRSDRVDGESDRLWSDDTLVRYINEAHQRFARRSFAIRDGSNNEATLITLKTGVSSYNAHPSVLAVISARYDDEEGDLRRIGRTSFQPQVGPGNLPYFDPTPYSRLNPGKPTMISTDDEVGLDDYDSATLVKIRVYPTPSVEWNNKKIRLRVVRTPIEPFDKRRLSAVPEIPDTHHMDMLSWAAYLALRIADADLGNPKLAEHHRAMFEEHVKDARTGVMRKLFAPTGWGFGRNGFAWEK